MDEPILATCNVGARDIRSFVDVRLSTRISGFRFTAKYSIPTISKEPEGIIGEVTVALKQHKEIYAVRFVMEKWVDLR